MEKSKFLPAHHVSSRNAIGFPSVNFYVSEQGMIMKILPF